jgi:phosphatidylserine/phosphatidylglycerophosphate/cardiolipin synthase-like enzyme
MVSKLQCIVGFFKITGQALWWLILQILNRAMPKIKSSRPKAAAVKRSKVARTKPYEKKKTQKQPQPDSLRKFKTGRSARLDWDHAMQTTDTMNVRVMFQKLGTEMVTRLDMTVPGDFVFAAVAWLTSKPILEAMHRAHKRGVIVLVVLQKEKWLRKGKSQNEFQKKLRSRYDALGAHQVEVVEKLVGNYYFGAGKNWRFDSKPLVASVRCLGDDVVSEFNARRMHHKFVVFGQRNSDNSCTATHVWTGSYNFSNSAELSLENAICIKDTGIANQYAREFAAIFLNTEPLDWISKTMSPTFTWSK